MPTQPTNVSPSYTENKQRQGWLGYAGPHQEHLSTVTAAKKHQIQILPKEQRNYWSEEQSGQSTKYYNRLIKLNKAYFNSLWEQKDF